MYREFRRVEPLALDSKHPITITPTERNGPLVDYEISDSTGRTAIARVNLSIAAVNDPRRSGTSGFRRS